MNDYLQSIIDRDPAAKSKLSLILTYPGVKAIFFHKIANFFAVAKFDLIARIISQISRFLTGIEIHPKATAAQAQSLVSCVRDACRGARAHSGRAAASA